MSFQAPGFVSMAIFLAIVLSMIAVVLIGARDSSKNDLRAVGLFLLVWIAAFSAYVISGYPRDHLIPGLPLFFGVIVLGGLYVGLGNLGAIFLKFPVWMFVLFQCFRLPLELVLHSWAEQRTIPNTMTWTGQNFDIATGVLALLALYKPFRSKAFAVIFNVIGSIFLLNVLRVVLMSSGLPFSWNVQPRFELMLHLPYAAIAFVLVFFALTGHLILARKLLTERHYFR